MRVQAVRTVPVVREQPVWLTEDEAFTLLMGLVRGAAAGSRSEDALLAKMGVVCRAFLRGAREIPVEIPAEETWMLEALEDHMCLQAA
jgi:hypothetical protein